MLISRTFVLSGKSLNQAKAATLRFAVQPQPTGLVDFSDCQCRKILHFLALPAEKAPIPSGHNLLYSLKSISYKIIKKLARLLLYMKHQISSSWHKGYDKFR
jgi:hypothetical protein